MESTSHAIELLREAAGILEAGSGETLLPEWDDAEGDLTEDRLAIAAAVEAVSLGGRVPVRTLGALVRYLADMLE